MIRKSLIALSAAAALTAGIAATTTAAEAHGHHHHGHGGIDISFGFGDFGGYDDSYDSCGYRYVTHKVWNQWHTHKIYVTEQVWTCGYDY